MNFGVIFSLAALTGLSQSCSVSPKSSAPAPTSTGDTTMGSQTSVSGTLTTEDINKQVSTAMQFDTEGAYTVQFQVTPPPRVAPQFGIFEAEADLSFSVGGNTIRRRCSIANGTSITGYGTAVRIVMRDKTVGGFSGADYTVAAVVAKGTRAGTGQPVILHGTKTVNFVPSMGSIVLDIPDDAGVISAQVQGSADDIANLPIQAFVFHKNAGGQLLKQYDINNGNFIPLAGQATQLEINNPSAHTIHVSVTWGIDG